MRLIKISDYDQLTMQLAKPIYDGKGRVLLAAGNTIHPKYLTKLKELGIRYLIVEDQASTGITLEEMLEMPTWMGAIQVLQDTYETILKKQQFPLIHVQKVVGQLLYEVKRRRAILLIPTTSLAEEMRPYGHAINVTLLALQIGKYLKYTDLQLRDLALGCMLHDIGKVKDPSEFGHPTAGFEILRHIRELSLLSAHVAFQHHETLDGKGFPRELKGDSILEFAQICGVANFYENHISKNNLPPHEVMEILMTMYGTKYLEHVVEALIKGIPGYPPGTMIRIQDNQEAIVIRIDDHMQRPVVRLLDTGQVLSLSSHPTVMITGIVESEEYQE
ncbi:HD domain-containing protein [Fodinisporobacter ferrooxydans]|uniref:HD domain-containing protein n=1 Tax=Fodinisporobacter ferrooxydans TaxID=2901836 RepID=A0ABY4CE91_9BACL|nr:HD domain-containing protein [Alicyclobacillaceae bacterium MYW30-H2]